MTTRNLSPGSGVADVRCDDDTLSVDLADGRTIIVPLAWYPRLLDATPAQRQNWQPCGGGFGIHWPEMRRRPEHTGVVGGRPRAAEDQNGAMMIDGRVALLVDYPDVCHSSADLAAAPAAPLFTDQLILGEVFSGQQSALGCQRSAGGLADWISRWRLRTVVSARASIPTPAGGASRLPSAGPGRRRVSHLHAIKCLGLHSRSPPAIAGRHVPRPRWPHDRQPPTARSSRPDI